MTPKYILSKLLTGDATPAAFAAPSAGTIPRAALEKAMPDRPVSMARAQAQLALALLVFVIAAAVPYSWLIAHFAYPGILQAPAVEILTKFHAGGSSLVFAWLAFGVSALLFIPVALGFERLFSLAGLKPNGSALMGAASALLQAIGLLRWVLVVPALASSFVAADSASATREAITVVFDAVHRYGGMVLGEFLGQLLLAAWTGLAGLQMMRANLVPRWLAVLGCLTLPLWVLGQSKLLHGVLPAIPSLDLIPLAFMAWELWLVAIAVVLLVRAWRTQA